MGEVRRRNLFCFAIREFSKDRLDRDIFHSRKRARRQEGNSVRGNNNMHSKREKERKRDSEGEGVGENVARGRKLAVVYCLVYNTGLS